jgi:hypothetical protein
MAKEFPIWGKPPSADDETLLHTRATSYKNAEQICIILAEEHGCTDMRIQTLDISQPYEGFVAALS